MDSIPVQLKPLTLAYVIETGKKLGSGAYGEVVEVRLSGLKCAGKKLHALFFDQSPREEQRAIVARFVEECVSLSKLRHPNIVQLIGVHYFGGARLPMMVMELLPGSLSQCLERHRQVPGYIKTSILYDVSLGLLYLHSQTPPLIHRDLTANNVLLTSNMSAKLADLGVARIVNLNPAQLTARMTQCPGTPAYMPPEALSNRPCYDEKLDVFSFGNLILHVCTHQWPLPAPLLAYDPQNPGVPKTLTELQRRQEYLDLIDKKHPLRAVAEKCLQNFPIQRPSTANIASELEQIHSSSATSSPEYLEMAMENLILNRREKQLRDENAQLRDENAQLWQQVHEKDSIIAELRKVKPSAPLPTVKPTGAQQNQQPPLLPPRLYRDACRNPPLVPPTGLSFESRSASLDSSGGNGDVSFDDLTRRLEELRPSRRASAGFSSRTRSADSGGGGGDVDFHALTQRFEELKRRR